MTMSRNDKFILGSLAVITATGAMLLASPDADAETYEARFCRVVDRDDTAHGVLVGIFDLQDQGMTADQVGDIVANAIINLCPEHLPAFTAAYRATVGPVIES